MSLCGIPLEGFSSYIFTIDNDRMGGALYCLLFDYLSCVWTPYFYYSSSFYCFKNSMGDSTVYSSNVRYKGDD